MIMRPARLHEQEYGRRDWHQRMSRGDRRRKDLERFEHDGKSTGGASTAGQRAAVGACTS
jgi:hypothetical protein